MTFSVRETVEDEYGNTEGGWVDQVTVAAGIVYLRGSEAVMASRLSGRQPVVIRVRQSSGTRVITVGWRAIDARSGEIFNIRTKVPSDDRAFFEMTAESGVAV